MLENAEERKTLKYILDFLKKKYIHPTRIFVGREKEEFVIRTEIDTIVSVDRLRYTGYTTLKPCEILCNYNKKAIPVIFE